MNQQVIQQPDEALIKTPRLHIIKSKIKETWEDGNYTDFARYMEAGAIEILKHWDIPLDSMLLDVGCGSGQLCIPAARSGYTVTGIDIAKNLIEDARKRALDENLTASFDVGDAENLPYAEHSFDTVMSMFGAMFAPSPVKVVNEFARVIRPGGSLYMANWTPASMPAHMFKCVSSITPPPGGVARPVLWGCEETVTQRLSEYFTDIQLTRKKYPHWNYPFSASALVDFFRTYFGPVKRAFDSANQNEQRLIHNELEDIYQSHAEITNDGITITGGEYLEVIATRR